MIEIITNVNSAINNVVWGWPALILLGFVGILMTCLTKFFQLSHIGHWLKNTVGAIFGDRNVTKHTEDKSISQFQSLCTALAATVGTGNIVGVAGAIAVGGPGAVFWMWLIAFFGMMTNYSENVLGILYRRKNAKGEWAGGAMYYLKDGLGSKKGCKTIGLVLSVLFSCFCLLASFGIGNMSQVNSMVTNVNTAFGIPVLANGDITTAEGAKQILEQTGCAGVMIGRGALGDPWLFERINAVLTGQPEPGEPSLNARMSALRAQIYEMCEEKGEWTAMPQARGQAMHYMKGLKGAASLRRYCSMLEHFTDVDKLIEAVYKLQG